MYSDFWGYLMVLEVGLFQIEKIWDRFGENDAFVDV